MADRVDEGTGPPEPGPRPVPTDALGGAPENAQTGWAAHRGGDFRVLGYLVTSAPIILFVFLRVAAPDFFDPLFTNPPAIAGLPFGIVIMAGVFAWTLVGILIVNRTRSSTGIVVALLVFTLPAIFVMLLTPAVVLIMVNLAT